MSEWYYVKNGEKQGPVGEPELKGLLAGTIPADTLVWKAGLTEWVAASTLPELASAPAIPSAPAVPSTLPISPVVSTEPVATLAPGSSLELGDIFNRAFAMFKTEWLNLSLLAFCYTVILGVLQEIPHIGGLLALAAGGMLMLGFWKAILDKVDGGPVVIASLFKYTDHWLMAAVVYLIVCIITLIGLFLLVIPGVIAALLLAFWAPLVIDRKIGEFESISASVELAKPHLLNLFLMSLLSFVIVIAGIICLGIGIFPAIAIIGLMWGIAYRQLSPKTAVTEIAATPV